MFLRQLFALICKEIINPNTCHNHNVDPETFESPRSERLGSLKITIVQKSLGGGIPSEMEEALRNNLLTVLCTIYPVYTVYNT